MSERSVTSGGGLGEVGTSGRRDVGVVTEVGDVGTDAWLLLLLTGGLGFLYGLVVELCGLTATYTSTGS